MVKIIKNILFALFLLLQTVTFSQTNSNIELKNNELASIKSQILKLENELKDKQANEAQTLKILDKISQQTHLLNKIIREIAFEEQQIEKRISNISNQIEKLKK